MGIHYNFIQKSDKLEASYFRGCLINQSPPKKFPIIVPVPQIRHPSDAIQFMDQTVDYLIPANLLDCLSQHFLSSSKIKVFFPFFGTFVDFYDSHSYFCGTLFDFFGENLFNHRFLIFSKKILQSYFLSEPTHS